MNNKKIWEGLKEQLDEMKENTLSLLLKCDSEFLHASEMMDILEDK